MYAVLRQGNHQYRVAPGDSIEVPLMDAEVGTEITLEGVLAVRNGEDFNVGSPVVAGAAVKAKVSRHARGEKVRVFKFTRRHGAERRKGHRQDFTQLYIRAITINGTAFTFVAERMAKPS